MWPGHDEKSCPGLFLCSCGVPAHALIARLVPVAFHLGVSVMSLLRSAIRTAVFPVAGRGTRFLPATKASPKEMLPVVDKPLIQYAVEEALAAGARRLVFITGSSKRAI